MHDATADNRGTLQQLARELDEARQDGMSLPNLCDDLRPTTYVYVFVESIALQLSPRFSRDHMPDELYHLFLAQLQMRLPLQRFHHDLAVPDDPTSIAVPNIAHFFDYAIISGSRYYAARRTTSLANSLAIVRVSESGDVWVAKILDIVAYNSPPVPHQLFAHVQWLSPAPLTFEGTAWESS